MAGDNLDALFLAHAAGRSSEELTIGAIIDFAVGDRAREFKQAAGTGLRNRRDQEYMLYIARNNVDDDKGWKKEATADLINIGRNYPDLWEVLCDYYMAKYDLALAAGISQADVLLGKVIARFPAVAEKFGDKEGGNVDAVIYEAINLVVKEEKLGQQTAEKLIQFSAAAIRLSSYVQSHPNEATVDENMVLRVKSCAVS